MNRNWLIALGTLVFLALGYYFSEIVTHLLIAWVLSMLGRPVCDFFQKHLRIGKFKMGPSGASLLTILFFFLVLVGLLSAFVPTIVGQARNLASVDYQALGEKLKGPFADLDNYLHRMGLLNTGESLATKTQEILSHLFGPTLVGDFLGAFVGVAGSIVVMLTTVTFILFFFLREPDLFLNMLHAVVPTGQEQKMRHVVQESSHALTRYFTGLLIQVTCFALAVALILMLLGIDNALLIGAFGGILIVIPYIGPIMGVLFGCFITISSHLDLDFNLVWPMLIKVAVTFLSVQALNDTFMGPLIFSKSVQAHPLEIFIVTLIAAKVGGILGMVIGIPVYTVLRVIARIYFSQFKVVQRLTGQSGAGEEPA